MPQMIIAIPIARLPGNEDLPLPAYQSGGAAGLDLYAAVKSPYSVQPKQIAIIPCGFAIAVPEGYEAQVRPRSGLAANFAVSIANSPGTIDSDYRGEISVILINHGQTEFVVTRGMRIAQLVLTPVCRISWEETGTLSPTPRGQAGFGHTDL